MDHKEGSFTCSHCYALKEDKQDLNGVPHEGCPLGSGVWIEMEPSVLSVHKEEDTLAHFDRFIAGDR